MRRPAIPDTWNLTLIALCTAFAFGRTASDKGIAQRTRPRWRQRTIELAEALCQSIRMQLSVEKYQAISIQRGANLDSIDKPLFNRKRLIGEFDKIRQMTSEDEKLEAMKQLLN